MTSDPVLSEVDPEAVVTAYQTLLTLAPELADERRVVILILRQSMQRMPLSYDTEQMVKLNQALRKIQNQ